MHLGITQHLNGQHYTVSILLCDSCWDVGTLVNSVFAVYIRFPGVSLMSSPHCCLCLQGPDAQPQAPVPNGTLMTDLERQFFANSQSPSSESSDSSSDSDQESLNAASEDDDDDGLDHF